MARTTGGDREKDVRIRPKAKADKPKPKPKPKGGGEDAAKEVAKLASKLADALLSTMKNANTAPPASPSERPEPIVSMRQPYAQDTYTIGGRPATADQYISLLNQASRDSGVRINHLQQAPLGNTGFVGPMAGDALYSKGTNFHPAGSGGGLSIDLDAIRRKYLPYG